MKMWCQSSFDVAMSWWDPIHGICVDLNSHTVLIQLQSRHALSFLCPILSLNIRPWQVSHRRCQIPFWSQLSSCCEPVDFNIVSLHMGILWHGVHLAYTCTGPSICLQCSPPMILVTGWQDMLGVHCNQCYEKQFPIWLRKYNRLCCLNSTKWYRSITHCFALTTQMMVPSCILQTPTIHENVMSKLR